MPRLSVIMTTLNSEKYVNASVDSILNQTFADYELIIVDGGSTDHTITLLQDYTDKRIRLFVLDGKRRSAQLNHGVHIATGTYAAIVDSDDKALPERFEEQVHYLDHQSEVSIVGSWANVISETETFLYTLRRPLSHKRIINNLLTMNGLCFGTSCWRKNIFDQYAQFNERLLLSEDTEWLVRIAPYAVFANIPKPLMLLRKTEKSRSRFSGQENTLFVSSIEQIIESSTYSGEEKMFQLGVLHYYYGTMSNARRYLIPSFLKRPLKISTLRYLCPAIILNGTMMKRARRNILFNKIGIMYRNIGVWIDYFTKRSRI